jgi:hypothetical protein
MTLAAHPKKTVAGDVKQPEPEGQLEPVRQSEVVRQPKVCVTVSDTGRGYVPVEDGFTADGCRSLAMSAHAESFALACATASNVEIGSPNDLREASQDLKLPASNTCNWQSESNPGNRSTFRMAMSADPTLK